MNEEIRLFTPPPSKGPRPSSPLSNNVPECSLPHSEPDTLGCGLRLGSDAETAGDSKYVFGVARTAEERKRVYAFRYSVYAEKMNRPNITDADHAEKIIYDVMDDSGCHFYVEYEGNIVGALRSHRIRLSNPDVPFSQRERDLYQLEPFMEAAPEGVAFSSRLIIDPEHRNGPVLNKLLMQTYEAALRSEIHFGFVHCSPSLVELYERMGYRRYADNIMDPVFGFKVPMVLALRDKDYLKSKRSPLARALNRHPEHPDTHEKIDWFNGAYRTAVEETNVRRDRKGEFWTAILDGLKGTANDPASLLRSLSEEEVLKLTREGTVLESKRGDAIIREMGYGNSMFLVLSGSAEMHLNGSPEILAKYGPGNVFGEISLVTDGPRTANVTVAEDSEFFVFTHDHLHRLMKTAPELAARVLLNISQILGARLETATRNGCASGMTRAVAA